VAVNALVALQAIFRFTSVLCKDVAQEDVRRFCTAHSFSSGC